MNDEELVKWLEESREAIRKLDRWADEKIESQMPLSDRQVNIVEDALKTIRKMKASISKLKADMDRTQDPPA